MAVPPSPENPRVLLPATVRITPPACSVWAVPFDLASAPVAVLSCASSRTHTPAALRSVRVSQGLIVSYVIC